jgi:hypothetical protein
MTLAELQEQFVKLKVQSCSMARRGTSYVCVLVVEDHIDIVKGYGTTLDAAVRDALQGAVNGS